MIIKTLLKKIKTLLYFSSWSVWNLYELKVFPQWQFSSGPEFLCWLGSIPGFWASLSLHVLVLLVLVVMVLDCSIESGHCSLSGCPFSSLLFCPASVLISSLLRAVLGSPGLCSDLGGTRPATSVLCPATETSGLPVASPNHVLELTSSCCSQ